MRKRAGSLLTRLKNESLATEQSGLMTRTVEGADMLHGEIKVSTTESDTYPVGLLRDLRQNQFLRASCRSRLSRLIKSREVRALYRYVRSGWLTEHPYPCAHNAGWGWSKRFSEIRADRECRKEAERFMAVIKRLARELEELE